MMAETETFVSMVVDPCQFQWKKDNQNYDSRDGKKEITFRRRFFLKCCISYSENYLNPPYEQPGNVTNLFVCKLFGLVV